MSGGCGYCGRSGHSIETCSKRLEARYGTPEDPSETAEELAEGNDE